MKITTKFVSDYEFESLNEAGNVARIDMYDKESKQAFSPMEHLLSAVAACASVDAVQMLKKKRKIVNAFTIESEGDRRTDYPKAFTHITLKFILKSPNTSEEELAKVIKLAVDKYCSVSASLSDKIDLKVESIVENV